MKTITGLTVMPIGGMTIRATSQESRFEDIDRYPDDLKRWTPADSVAVRYFVDWESPGWWPIGQIDPIAPSPEAAARPAK